MTVDAEAVNNGEDDDGEDVSLDVDGPLDELPPAQPVTNSTAVAATASPTRRGSQAHSPRREAAALEYVNHPDTMAPYMLDGPSGVL